MRDSVAGSEICRRTNSRLVPAASSHFCGKGDGREKIFKWKLQRQIKLKKWYEQNKQATGTQKQKDLSRDELRSVSKAQLSKSERAALRQLSKQPKNAAKEEKRVSVSDAVQCVEEHLFDRNSVVLEFQLWQ